MAEAAKKKTGISKTFIARKIRSFFKAKDGISLVFLFGSLVRDQMNSQSDVDVGILFDKVPDFYEINNIKGELSSLIKKEVDLAVLNEASPILRMQVLKNGVMILEKQKNAYSFFYSKTVQEYDDLKQIRKTCEDNILKGRIYA